MTRNVSTPATLPQLKRIKPIQFELFVANIFKSRGYSVKTTPVTGDGGVDLLVRTKDEFAVVHCKRFRRSVGETVIRDLYGAIMHVGANKGYLVTTGHFSRKAHEFAMGKPIELVDGKKLMQWERYRLASDNPSQLGNLFPTGHKNGPNFAVVAGLIICVFLVVLVMLLLRPLPTIQDTDSANGQLVLTAAAPTPQIEAFLRSQLANLNGIQSVDQVKSIKAEDGYTILVNATIARDYQDINFARAMFDIVKGNLDASIVQLIIFLDDTHQVVNYVWSSWTDQWEVSTRDN